jgi:S1-C subfamily serine protease
MRRHRSLPIASIVVLSFAGMDLTVANAQASVDKDGQRNSSSRRKSAQATGIQAFENLAASLVRIRTATSVEIDRKNPLKLTVKYRFGTGFFAQIDGVVVTAAHNLRDRAKPPAEFQEIGVMSRDAQQYSPAVLMAEDLESDVALLRVNPRSFPAAVPLQWHDRPLPVAGTRVYALGIRGVAPERDFELMMVAGETLDARDEIPRLLKDAKRSLLPWIAISAFVLDGHSGGPVLDGDGEPVGLIVGSKEVQGEWKDFSLCISVARVSELMRNVKNKRTGGGRIN